MPAAPAPANADAHPSDEADAAADAAQPAPAAPAARKAPARPVAQSRAGDAAAQAEAKAASTAKAEDAQATGDATAASADEDDTLDTPELKEFTQLLGMNAAPPDAAAAAAKPAAHRGRAAAADADEAPQGRAVGRTVAGEAGGGAEPAAATGKPGELRADKPAARVASEASQSTAALQSEHDAASIAAGPAAAASSAAPTAPSFAAMLAQALPTAAALPDAAPAATYAGVQAPLHSHAFAPELGARVSLLAVDGVQQAELQLNPADMGPVSVQITVDGNQAQVSFHALQAETRQALEQSLPDLAAALQGQGLTLSGGGVFQQAPRDANHGEGEANADAGSGHARGGSARVDGTARAAATPQRRSVGLLDTFA
ncbi:MAG: flagellar hook-length control protein FliK [Rubrivivax sp.]|nr:MAG: flagellar hook-length control protein FliK [Rubrivivax sp.]